MFNNEVGFREENIKAICDVGFSTKKNEDGYKGYIGEKGIGFKSVFLVSSRPHIFSGGYSIYLDREPHPAAKLGYLIPTWINNPPSLGANGQYETSILLPLESKDGGSYKSKIKKDLEELAPEVILFLRKLKGISVSGISEGIDCLLYTSPSPRDATLSRMPSSA